MRRSDRVAPLVGAWIEIRKKEVEAAIFDVAPLVGAWIEIYVGQMTFQIVYVAPLVGAWIEIKGVSVRNGKLIGRSSCRSVD